MNILLRSVLLGEYTSPKNRGAFISTINMGVGLGIFFSHLLGSLLTWRATAIICIFFPASSFIATFYFPESPMWLASKGRHEECRNAFRWLRGYDEEKELEAMIEASNVTNEEDDGVKRNLLQSITTTIRKKEFYKPIILMIHVYDVANFTAGPILTAYGVKVLDMTLGPEANIRFWLSFIDITRVLFSFLAVYIVRKCKRRILMIVSTTLCIVSLLSVAGYTLLTGGKYNKYLMWIPLMFTILQILTVAIGMMPLKGVLAGEVFPLQYKGIGGMISGIIGSAVFFGMLKTFPGLVESYGLHGTYAIYAAILAYHTVVILLMMPETKGKTLQEIEEETRGKPLAYEEVEASKPLQKDTNP